MRLPAHMLTSTAQVLAQGPSGGDRLGQGPGAWAPQGDPLPCAHFPAGTRIVTQAQLRGVKVAREVYLERTGLSPQANRLRLDGTEYVITLVNDWPGGFAQVGVVTP